MKLVQIKYNVNFKDWDLKHIKQLIKFMIKYQGVFNFENSNYQYIKPKILTLFSNSFIMFIYLVNFSR